MESKSVSIVDAQDLKKNMKRTGMAGIFAASLELTKEGVVKVLQNKIFDKLMIKKS